MSRPRPRPRGVVGSFSFACRTASRGFHIAGAPVRSRTSVAASGGRAQEKQIVLPVIDIIRGKNITENIKSILYYM